MEFELAVGLFAETSQAALRRNHYKYLNLFGQNRILQVPWRQRMVLFNGIEFRILWPTNPNKHLFYLPFISYLEQIVYLYHIKIYLSGNFTVFNICLL